MKVFFDNCTSPILAATLDAYIAHLGHSAVHIRDLPCGRDATDLAWIGYLASTNLVWLVITGDGRIQKNKAERQAFRQANLRGVALAPAYQKTPIHQQAAILLWRWPNIEGLTRTINPPFLFELPMKRLTGIRQLPI